MKKFLLVSVIALTLSCLFYSASAQGFLNKLKQKAVDKANQKSDQAVDKAVDKPADATTSTDKKTGDAAADNNSPKEETPAAPPTITAYQNYDFRAGDKIIFADNFASDPDGEFASHWDLVAGQAVVNKVTGVSSFLLTDGNYARVKPLMKTNTYMTPGFFYRV